MMFREEVRAKIAEELARAAQARQEGLEGRARVCARRAAGAAVREYLYLKGEEISAPNPTVLLDLFADQPGIPEAWRKALKRLMSRVDENYALPEGVDLLADTEWLARELEKQV